MGGGGALSGGRGGALGVCRGGGAHTAAAAALLGGLVSAWGGKVLSQQSHLWKTRKCLAVTCRRQETLFKKWPMD